MKLLKNILKLCSISIMILVILSGCSSTDSDYTALDIDMRDITTMEIVKEMGIGINLGNTLEASGSWIARNQPAHETAWGSPIITKPLIDGYANAGFNSVRVPINWIDLLKKSDGDWVLSDDGKNVSFDPNGEYVVSQDVLERAKQIVDWIIENDMYAMINMHHEEPWFNLFPTNYDECIAIYESIWSQIADYFKDYNDYLIFESQNENMGFNSLWNEYGPNSGENLEGKIRAFEIVNNINQKFVDVVRSSGGNNDKRHLLIAGYYTNINHTCDPMFVMPNDPVNRMAISVHYYGPAVFAILDAGADAGWGVGTYTWGTQEDIDELHSELEKMVNRYVKNNIPVIIGEHGCATKGRDAYQIRNYILTVSKTIYDYGMCPMFWDTPGGQYNRTELSEIDIIDLQNVFKDDAPNEPNPTIYEFKDPLIGKGFKEIIGNKVTFDSRGGSAVILQFINTDGKITKPADPTRTGYKFKGWYKDEKLKTPWNFDTDTVITNTTLYAKWAKA